MLPKNEKIIETKKCRLSGMEFVVTDKDLEFYDKVSPIFGGKKYSIPSPTLCPEERMRRRLSFRNERKIYMRKCDKTGADMISIYAPDKPYTVYEQKIWWSDDWSPFDYGIKFDLEKNFFEQFNILLNTVPLQNLHVLGNENSNYVNQCGYTKDSYMCTNTDFSEKCLYTANQYKTRNCVDSFIGQNNENCYQLIDSSGCYNCKYLLQSNHCSDSYFLQNCQSCNNCIGCNNKVNKSYCIFNTQYTKEEYQKKCPEIIQKLNFSSFQSFIKNSQLIVKNNILNSENCFGDNIINSKNIFFGFNVENSENIRFASIFSHGKDCYDYDNGGYQSELCYELVGSGDKNYHCLFSPNIWSDTSNICYSDMIKSSSELFGCVRITKKSHHCIFNSPYSVQEYETLCGKIIDHMRSTGEWGEFFPHELSLFGYNESIAQEFLPITKEEAILKKWNWRDEPTKLFEENGYIPLSISSYDEKLVGYITAQKNIDEVLTGIIKCEVTGKPFKIIRQELAFYIENRIPLPTKHPNQRHKERMELRNPRKLFERKCDQCGCDMVTTYAPERKEKVVCEECYRKLVY